MGRAELEPKKGAEPFENRHGEEKEPQRFRAKSEPDPDLPPNEIVLKLNLG